MGPKGMGFPADGVENHGWKLYITSLVVIGNAGFFVLLRCASRIYLFNFGSDDVVIIISLLFSIVLSVAIQLAIENGYGMHKDDLTVAELTTALRWFFIAQTPYKVTVCLNKVATILLYLRIFVTKKFQIAAYTVMAIIVAWSIGAVGATIFQCIPIEGAWDKRVAAKCINSDMFWVAYAVMNILTDVMVLALPIPPIVTLQLSTRTKLMLCALFTMGGFVVITSILRAASVRNSIGNKADSTWDFIDRGMWTLIEANAGIIGACLPTLRQPLSRLFPQIFGSTAKSSDYQADRTPGKGAFTLSNISGQASHPGMWHGGGHSRQVVSVSGPAVTSARKSDELSIINDDVKESDGGSDLQGSQGISKTVDVVRTSFHMDPA
ncbi:integral membrane [Trichoderma cornu-damae]|uniref:Integral membrane n=1 Tax=Trichoderma cornu-damae TaxID=654480 RepID=A0A9P8QH37_9HYPO|nr:integral membrane [Trichoderma cornu-damae]